MERETYSMKVAVLNAWRKARRKARREARRQHMLVSRADLDLKEQRDYRTRQEDSHMYYHAVETHGGRLDPKWKFVIIKTFQKSLTRQLSEAVRIKQRGEDMVLNKKGVYNRCAVPELAVVHNSKLWEEEKRKFIKGSSSSKQHRG